MNNNIFLLILGMAAVTYIPRLLPFLVLSNQQIPERLNAFLKCIPAAAIGALIIPGALSATPDMPLASVAGMIFTLILGMWKGGIIVPVLGSIFVTYLVLFCLS